MKLDISLDVERVQSSVQAAIRPAVENALKSVDVEKTIRAILLKKKEKDAGRSMYLSMFGGTQHPEINSLLDEMIYDGIKEIAKHYVSTALRDQKPMMHEALQKMMADSSSKLVNHFVGAIENGLKDHWGFDISMKVEAKEPERSYDD